MSTAFKIATRQVDVASMREAVLALQSLARQSESAKDLPPVEFALRYGVVPPVLAGRAKEMAILEWLVEGVQAGKGDQSLLGLHGIRGQGKTALLRLLENIARQAGIHVVVLRAAKTGADFAQAVMEAESLAGTTSDSTAKEGVVGVNALLKAQGRSATTRLASETRTARVSLDAAVQQRLARGDRILLVLDEAHTLRKDAGQELFNTYQDCGVRGAALGLAFAGTPDLPDRLADMGVTFTERPGRYGQHPLGPISEANAVMAVLAPFAERGAVPNDMVPDIPGGIVESIASACCGYPYYTQLLGAALHEAWAANGAPNRIAERHWRQALTTFETQRREHYQRRFAELRAIGAVQCARNLAAALKERGAIAQDVLEHCVAQGLRERNDLESAAKIVREETWLDGIWSPTNGMASALLHLGFLWSPQGSGGERFQAGIPSLADHVLEAAPPPASA